MTTSAQIAKHVRDVFFGGNWTSVNVKDSLQNITWQQATKQVSSLNTIAALLYHMNYYVTAVLEVLWKKPLNAHDKFSFDVPAITSEQEWEKLQNTVWADVEALASLTEQLPDHQLHEIFEDEKYGTWYRNLHGIIEHTHYHLGQIVLIKKILSANKI